MSFIAENVEAVKPLSQTEIEKVIHWLNVWMDKAHVEIPSVRNCVLAGLRSVGPGGIVPITLLCQETGLSRVTVHKASMRLIGLKLFSFTDEPAGGRGKVLKFRVTAGLNWKVQETSKPIKYIKPKNPTSENEVFPEISKSWEIFQTAQGFLAQGLEGRAWRWGMKSLRWGAWASGLTRREQSAVTASVGKWSAGKPVSGVLSQIAKVIQALAHKEWIADIRKWGFSIVKSFGKAEAYRALHGLIRGQLNRRQIGFTSRAILAKERLSRVLAWLGERELESICGACGRVHDARERRDGEDTLGKINCFGWARQMISDLRLCCKLT